MKHIFFIFILFAISICASISAEKVCSREEAIRAETESSSLQDWDGVYESFVRFGHCDDGAISEGYSESVGRLLAKNNGDLVRLNELAQGSATFTQFIIHHIDDTVPSDYLVKIIENVKLHCPENAKQLCDLIYSAAK